MEWRASQPYLWRGSACRSASRIVWLKEKATRRFDKHLYCYRQIQFLNGYRTLETLHVFYHIFNYNSLPSRRLYKIINPFRCEAWGSKRRLHAQTVLYSNKRHIFVALTAWFIINKHCKSFTKVKGAFLFEAIGFKNAGADSVELNRDKEHLFKKGGGQ